VYRFCAGQGKSEGVPVDDMKAVLDGLEAQVAEVKRQYDLFFQGGRRSEPLEERRALEARVRQMAQRRIVNTSDQFRFNAIQGRFYSLLNLWTRTVRNLEGGCPAREAAGSAPAGVPGGPEPEIDAAVERLREARAACGLPAGPAEMAAIREALRAEARRIAERSGRRIVEFRVTVEDGRPRIRAVTR